MSTRKPPRRPSGSGPAPRKRAKAATSRPAAGRGSGGAARRQAKRTKGELRATAVTRFRIFFVLVLVVAAWPMSKLGAVVIGDRDMAAEAAKDRIEHRPIKAPRGAIVDRNHSDMAISLARVDVAADMSALSELAEDDPLAYDKFGAFVADAIGEPEQWVREEMYAADPDDPYVPLAKKVDLETADELREKLLGEELLPALNFEASSERVHPSGESGLRVLGTISDDGPGPNAGVERQYDEYLKGEPGLEVQEVGDDGSVIPGTESVVEKAEQGATVRLSLDRNLQYEAEKALLAGVEQAGAAGGVAIVGRPGTGELLAAAGVSQDPESGEIGLAESPKPFSDAYQAGSVFKLVPVAAAIEDGNVDLNTTFEVADFYQSYDRTFTDHDPHPRRTMTVEQILAQSSNVGTIHIADTLGRERMHEALREFGFGEKTGVSPAESAGVLPPVEEWSGPDLAATAIGSRQSATAVQLWSAYNVIANDGIWIPPRLVEEIEPIDGDPFRPELPPERQVVPPETAEQVKTALRAVVTDGTGKKWDLPGFPVGAKTGTGRMVAPEITSTDDAYMWSDGRYHHMAAFTGFFPVDDPKVSITVILEDVDYGLSGSSAAGPVFAELARLAIRELGVVPASGDSGSVLGPQRAQPAGQAPPPAGDSSDSSADADTQSGADADAESGDGTSNSTSTSTPATSELSATSSGSDNDDP